MIGRDIAIPDSDVLLDWLPSACISISLANDGFQTWEMNKQPDRNANCMEYVLIFPLRSVPDIMAVLTSYHTGWE